MKTNGIITSPAHEGFASLQTEITTTTPARGELFTLAKDIVRRAAFAIPALVFMGLTNAYNAVSHLVIFAPANATDCNGVVSALRSTHSQGDRHQTFVMQPDPVTNDYKARGEFTCAAPESYAQLAEGDVRYLLREVVLPRVVRKFEAAIPAEEGGGTVTEETAPRLYSTSSLIAALQKVVETDARLANYKLGVVVDERNHSVHAVLIADGQPNMEARGIAQAQALSLDFIAARVTTDPAPVEEATAGEFFN